MNVKLLSTVTFIWAGAFGSASAQHVLASDNALKGARIEAVGPTMLPESAFRLTDGDFTSVCRIDSVNNPALVYYLDSPWIVSGWNVVAGSDLSLTDGEITIYACDEHDLTWIPITNIIEFRPSHPYTGIIGPINPTGAYSCFKIEFSNQSGNPIELSEIQLLGRPATPCSLQPSFVEKTDSSIQYTFNCPKAISAYSLTVDSASEASGRPASWELLASDDGQQWVTLDIHSNAESFPIDCYISTRSLSNQNGGICYADISDRLFHLADTAFLRPYADGKYLINSWHADKSKEDLSYNYWWMAHAIDACIDAYERTSDDRFRAIADDIKTGMYTAYDSLRYDLWNSYFDDMEWMNLACIRAGMIFPDSSRWLSEAIQLFDWIWQGWNYDNGSEGGIRWNSEDGIGKNSCSNAPAIIGAARLYQITGEKHYLDKALMIFDWMLTHSRFDDGFIKDSPGNDNRSWTFTYNQGTWIGGLLELYRITNDSKFRDIAVDLIDRCLFSSWYSPRGILRESGWGDGGMFKGILIRYITDWILSGYLDSERQYRYAQYIVENARSLYNCALRLPEMKVMPDWKHRSDRPDGRENGRPDGYYCSTNLLSGIFLLESADKLRRAGLTDADYNVVNSYVGKPFRHYRINFTDTHGSDDGLRVGDFLLYE